MPETIDKTPVTNNQKYPVEMAKQEAKERIHNFNEVALGYKEE